MKFHFSNIIVYVFSELDLPGGFLLFGTNKENNNLIFQAQVSTHVDLVVVTFSLPRSILILAPFPYPLSLYS